MDMGRNCCANVGRFLKAIINLLGLILVLCTHFVDDSGLQEPWDISTTCCSHTPYIVANNVRLIDMSAQRDKLINRFSHRGCRDEARRLPFSIVFPVERSLWRSSPFRLLA
jgi:hypothetical protein